VRTFFGYCLISGSYFKGGLDDVRLYNYMLWDEIDSFMNLVLMQRDGLIQMISHAGSTPNPASEEITLTLPPGQNERME
jgi:hypothetical protein